jgi:hypothetical protein
LSEFVPIYAVDFDGTLCESQWPGIGAPNIKLIEHLIKRRSQGAKLILWTCRVDERLQESIDWCKEHGLEFDAVNDNLPEMIEKYGNNTRKILATCYIDDLAVDKEKYGIPFHRKQKLIPCPLCGKEIDENADMYLPERDWKPTFYDPDSGGDPIYIRCKCGLEFSTGTYDYAEFINAWNRRVRK